MKTDFLSLKSYWEHFLKINGLENDQLFNDFEECHFNFLNGLFSKISKIDGNIVECGVGYGKSFLIFSQLIKLDKVDRCLWGFDSFQGFPEPSDYDKSDRNPKKGEWSKSSINLIKNLLINVDGDNNILRNIKIIKGFIEKTLPKYNNDLCPIALLHLDVDLYDSYKVSLEILWKLVAKNGIIIFDEYQHPKWPGATVAINNFFKDKNQKIIRDKFSNRHYLIKK